MTRLDGRQDNELRQLALESALLSRADGSAKFSCGPVSVLASVSGPMEVRLRDELVDRAALEINIRPVRGLPGPPTKALVDSLESILTPVLLLNRHPRSLIQISLQTISLPSTRYSRAFRTFQEDASRIEDDDEERVVDEDLASPDSQSESVTEKAAAINAATCSLLDAAIGMKAVICAAALAIVKDTSTSLESDASDRSVQRHRILLDPTAEEEREAQATICVAFAYGMGVGGTEGEVCYFDMTKGSMEETQLYNIIEVARLACLSTLKFMRKTQEMRYLGGR